MEQNEAIYGIPDSETYEELLNVLEREGYKIHHVMRSRKQFDEYPHLVYSDGCIHATRAEPYSKLPYASYTWTPYVDFAARIGFSNGVGDWKEKLSQLFQEKINNGNQIH